MTEYSDRDPTIRKGEDGRSELAATQKAHPTIEEFFRELNPNIPNDLTNDHDRGCYARVVENLRECLLDRISTEQVISSGQGVLLRYGIEEVLVGMAEEITSDPADSSFDSNLNRLVNFIQSTDGVQFVHGDPRPEHGISVRDAIQNYGEEFYQSSGVQFYDEHNRRFFNSVLQTSLLLLKEGTNPTVVFDDIQQGQLQTALNEIFVPIAKSCSTVTSERKKASILDLVGLATNINMSPKPTY